MEQIQKRLQILQSNLSDALQRLNIEELENKRLVLESEMADPHFWDDSQRAQIKSKEHARIEAKVRPWLELKQAVDESTQLSKTKDEELIIELERELARNAARFEEMKNQLKLAGKYDELPAIVTLHAGAGGTDAQDWAQMLLRMYIRWAETHDFSVTLLNESAGEEAGIKSATLEIDGVNAAGLLQSEHGVHRLVRLSPFNSDNLRQTSFAMVEVVPKIDTPESIKIDEKDIKIDVYRSGGRGGQSVNTTDSAVRITHVPTGIVVAIQNERSQLQNKDTAMGILKAKLAHLQSQQHVEKIEELRGPTVAAEWGNQIRNYVIHPYKQVKDTRTGYQSNDPDAVLDGNIDNFIEAYLDYKIGNHNKL